MPMLLPVLPDTWDSTENGPGMESYMARASPVNVSSDYALDVIVHILQTAALMIINSES